MPRVDRTGFTALVPALARSLIRRQGRPSRHGYAVRLDWASSAPGAVYHDFAQFTPSLRRALRWAASTRRFWVRGPLRPLAVTVVPIDSRSYQAHPRECVSPSCPTTAPLLGMDPKGLDTPADHTSP